MITPEQIQQIAAKITAAGVGESTVSILRQDYPQLHFTYCMDDDVPLRVPAAEFASFNLYLVDGREHCLCLTGDYEAATGLVIAEICDDPV